MKKEADAERATPTPERSRVVFLLKLPFRWIHAVLWQTPRPYVEESSTHAWNHPTLFVLAHECKGKLKSYHKTPSKFLFLVALIPTSNIVKPAPTEGRSWGRQTGACVPPGLRVCALRVPGSASDGDGRGLLLRTNEGPARGGHLRTPTAGLGVAQWGLWAPRRALPGASGPGRVRPPSPRDCTAGGQPGRAPRRPQGLKAAVTQVPKITIGQAAPREGSFPADRKNLKLVMSSFPIRCGELGEWVHASALRGKMVESEIWPSGALQGKEERVRLAYVQLR